MKPDTTTRRPDRDPQVVCAERYGYVEALGSGSLVPFDHECTPLDALTVTSLKARGFQPGAPRPAVHS